MINVLIVDDQLSIRQILETFVKKAGEEYNIVATIASANMARMYVEKGNIDLIIMDVYTAYGENGIDVAEKIKKDFPQIKIIIVTSLAEYSFIKRARNAKCDSFWYKDAGERELSEIIQKTMLGQSIYPREQPVVEVGECMSTDLTEREIAVLRCLIEEYSYKEIENELGITSNTIKYHIKEMLRKTGYRTTIGLIADVVGKKLIIPGF